MRGAVLCTGPGEPCAKPSLCAKQEMGWRVSVERPEFPARLGKYEIQAILGRGAMGVVYRAYDSRIDRTVAIKAVDEKGLDPERRESTLARFMQEARAAGRLMHPNVVGVFEFDQDGDIAFIAMEFIDGVDLRTFIQQHRGRLPRERVRSVLAQLLAALDYSHAQGVVHRDVKPANVFMMRDGTLKLGDFGIAKLQAGATSQTRAGTIMGTPNYMSPEHFSGRELDGRSDLFSAGVMLYELATGTRPFSGDVPTILNQILHHQPPPPSRLNPTLPLGLDGVVQKALAKAPDDRYTTAGEFAAALEEAFATPSRLQPAQPGTAPAPPPAPAPIPAPAQVAAQVVAGPEPVSGDGGLTQNTDPGSVTAGPRQDGRRAGTLTVSPWGDAQCRTLGEAVQHAQPHDRILVTAGTYDESLYIDKPLSITGQGAAVLTCGTSHCLKVAADGVRVRNLIIRGKGEGTDRPAVSIGRGNALFENCDISSLSRVCVSIRGRAAAPRFRDCRIHDSGGVGIHFAMNSLGRVENCSLYGHPVAPVQMDKGARPEIVGGTIQQAAPGRGESVSAGRLLQAIGRQGGLSGLFQEAGEDLFRGALQGGVLGLAGGAALVFGGGGGAFSATLLGFGVGLVTGFARAALGGMVLGALVALVLSPVSLPAALMASLLGELGSVGGGAGAALPLVLNLGAKGVLIGACVRLLAGAYQQLRQRAYGA
jgi:tRNA A-37 threonylcarbamoyl transferase component Bud32